MAIVRGLQSCCFAPRSAFVLLLLVCQCNKKACPLIEVGDMGSAHPMCAVTIDADL